MNMTEFEIVAIKDIDPIITYNGNIFLSIEELHEWKIKHIWNGIDIAVTTEDILR